MITPKTKEVIKDMFDALDSPCKVLTKWEEDFLSSIHDQFERRNTLTDDQFRILEGIYSEKTN